MRISCVWFGSVRFRPEQMSAVTDSVPEQQRPDHTITNCSVCVGVVPGDLDGRRIFTNGEKAAEMFCRVEELIAANGTRSSAPFTWLFMRPPWATTGACCKECVFMTMNVLAV